MTKLPVDQKYQLNHSLLDQKKYSKITLQKACQAISNCSLMQIKISLSGCPSDIITIKEEPIHSIMISVHSCFESIYIGDIQDGITCTFTPRDNATRLVISKRSVFLNGELVEFVLNKKAPFKIGDAVRLKESFFRKTFYVKKIPYGKVEAITPMDGKFLVTFGEPQAGKEWQFWSNKLELVPPKFKVGDKVRLTKKYMSEADKPLREGKIHSINCDGKIEFYHNKQLCFYKPVNLELVPQPDPIELAFKVGDKVETLSKYREELINRYHIAGFSGIVTQMHDDSGTISSTVKIGEGHTIRVSTRFLIHQKCPDLLEFLSILSIHSIKSAPIQYLPTKPTLYYIVRKGTNAIFTSKHTGKHLLVDSSRIEYETEQVRKQSGHEHEAISTSEYKKKYIRC